MTEKKTGRPPKYTEEQVLKGIEIVERNGKVPTGETVKNAMCEQLCVAPGINAQSLEKEMLRLIEERRLERRNRFIAALPSATLAAAKEIGLQVEAAVLGHLGEQHNELRTFAGKRLEALNVDLSNQREQIRELLLSIERKDGQISELEIEKHDLEGHLDLAKAEIISLKENIAKFAREDDLRAEILAMMKETLGQQVKETAA